MIWLYKDWPQGGGRKSRVLLVVFTYCLVLSASFLCFPFRCATWQWAYIFFCSISAEEVQTLISNMIYNAHSKVGKGTYWSNNLDKSRRGFRAILSTNEKQLESEKVQRICGFGSKWLMIGIGLLVYNANQTISYMRNSHEKTKLGGWRQRKTVAKNERWLLQEEGVQVLHL